MDDTPRSQEFDDVYFSADGGPEETSHVFFDGNNLGARWQDGVNRFVIGETGFGTGLNFLLAWDLFDKMAPRGAFLDFVSVEKFPLSVEEIRQGLSPWADRLSPYLEKLLAQYPMRVPGFHRVVFDNRIALTLIFDDANDALPEIEGSVDAWFLDGFTPSKNPDMWTDKVFGEMARLSHAETTFATFTAAGFVKRGLREAGFTVTKRDGFGRKRDMLAGSFGGKNPRSLVNRPKNITIMGAGLAGTAAAYVLKQYGFAPILHDPNGIASGASGNPLGIINPRFTALRTPDSDFYTAAFAQAVRTFPNIPGVGYERCGSLHLITDEDKQNRFAKTAAHWGWPESHMQLLSPEEASIKAGLVIAKPALFLPDSGQINPSLLCRHYAQGTKVETNPPPESDTIIYASGPALAADLAFAWLPLQTVRGQITFVKATPQSAALKTNLCYSGYISAPVNGSHVIGSTFQKWMSDTNPLDEDDAYNLQRITENISSLTGFTVTGHRAALRTASQDRFPVIGPMPGTDHFITTGHGSHGLISTLAGAHLLADYLRGGPFSVGKSTLNALSPERFIRRANRKTAP